MTFLNGLHSVPIVIIHLLTHMHTHLAVMQLSLLNRRSTGGERSAMVGGGHMRRSSRVQFSGVARRSARGTGRGLGRGTGSALMGVASSERALLTREMSARSQSASPTHEKSIAIKKVRFIIKQHFYVCVLLILCELCESSAGRIKFIPQKFLLRHMLQCIKR